MEHPSTSHQHMKDVVNQIPDFDIDSIAPAKPDVSAFERLPLRFKRRLLAFEDINDANGHCVLAKGEPLNKKVADLISRHSLARNHMDFSPYEENMDLAHLAADLKALLANQFGLNQIDITNGGTNIWHSILVSEFLILSEYKTHLAALACEQPVSYEQSLFCSWLAALLASTLQFDHEKIRSLVLAGLFHQVGRLYLPEELKVISEKKCNIAVWDEFQMNVIHGKNVFKGMNGYSEDIAHFIQIQGEYLNGLGFPFAEESDKSEDGILCLCRDIYMHVIAGEVELDKLGVYLQVHQLRYGLPVCWAMKHLLKGGLLKHEHVGANFDLVKAAENIIRQSLAIAQFDVMLPVLLKAVRECLGGTMSEYLIKATEQLVKQIEMYMKNSGISDVEFLVSIDRLANADSEIGLIEVEDFLGAQGALIELFAEVGQVLVFILNAVDQSRYSDAYDDIKSVALLLKETLAEYESYFINQG